MERTQVTAPVPGWMTWAQRGAVVLIVVACAAAWTAVDRTDRAARAQAQVSEKALAVTIDLAGATADLGARLETSVDALVVGTGSAGEAIAHTVTISQNLRVFVGVVASLDNLAANDAAQLTAVTNSLGDLEASLLETAGGLGETQQALTDVQPKVQAAAATLLAIADDLRSVSAGHRDHGGGRAFWRLAIVLTGVVLVMMTAALLAVLRRSNQP